jgi:hypothetical protein
MHGMQLLWGGLLLVIFVAACQTPMPPVLARGVALLTAVTVTPSATPTPTPTVTATPTPIPTRTLTPSPTPTFNLTAQCEAFRAACDFLRAGDEHGNPPIGYWDQDGNRVDDCGRQLTVKQLVAQGNALVAMAGRVPECLYYCPEYAVYDGFPGAVNPLATNDPTPEASATETPTPEATP